MLFLLKIGMLNAKGTRKARSYKPIRTKYILHAILAAIRGTKKYTTVSPIYRVSEAHFLSRNEGRI